MQANIYHYTNYSIICIKSIVLYMYKAKSIDNKYIHFYTKVKRRKNMELIAVAALKSGMEIAQDVLDHRGNIIMRADTCLDKHLIQKLNINSILCVYIKEPEDYCTTYFEKIKNSKTFHQFYQVYYDNFYHFKYLLDSFINNPQAMDNESLFSIIYNITNPFRHSKITILDMLSVLESSDTDIFYTHSLNVALICNYTGKWFGLSDEDVNTLVLCGFYYDIGKCKIPSEIQNKQGKLSQEEFNITKNHTLYGYQMLLNCDIDNRVKLSALMHHERCDGSGYPQKLTDESINKFAKIIAILDSYEAMTSFRTYRDPLCPFTVIEIFEKDGYGKYDTACYLTFLERMVDEYIGKEVQLTDGTICTVVLNNKQSYSRPMVKTSDDNYIDLSSRKDVKIESLI